MAYGIKLHCWGEWACFTRPEMKVERVSYDAMTPSAARGVVEAIYWKPEIRWRIDRITVLKPIRFASVRRNEVRDKIATAAVAKAMKDGKGNLAFYVDEGDNRQQRATLMLRDVGYVIEAHIRIAERAPTTSPSTWTSSTAAPARAAVSRGRTWAAASLWRNFALLEADSAILPAIDPSLAGERDLGWMLHDIDFARSEKQARFFRAVMQDGVIDVPAFAARGWLHDPATPCRAL